MKSAACETWAAAIEARAAASPPEPPGSDPAASTDPLEILARVQAGLERDLARLPPAQVVQRRAIASVLVQVAKGAESIRKGRPIEESADEVLERVRGAMAASVEFLLRQTREAAAKLEADRRAFAAWCRETLAPSHAAEVVERVSAIVEGRTCARCSKPRKGELPVCAEHEQAETVGGPTT